MRQGPSFPRKWHSSPPSFRPMSIVATVAHLSYCWALVVCSCRHLVWCTVSLFALSLAGLCADVVKAVCFAWSVTVTWLQMSVTAVTTNMFSVIHVFLHGRWHLEKIHRSALFAGMTVNFLLLFIISLCITVLNNVLSSSFSCYYYYIRLTAFFPGEPG